jgi:K+/H+ antiporter YhaU regulatory subunit KhtT
MTDLTRPDDITTALPELGANADGIDPVILPKRPEAIVQEDEDRIRKEFRDEIVKEVLERLDDRVTIKEVEEEIAAAMPDLDFDKLVTRDDLDEEIETINQRLRDMDDYVLDRDLDDRISSILEETDLVGDVVTGAVNAAAGTFRKLAEMQESIDSARLVAANANGEANLAGQRALEAKADFLSLTTMSFGARLRWLFTGKVVR